MAYGGSSEFRLIAGDGIGIGIGNAALSTSQFGLGGGQLFVRISSDMSTDFAGIAGYFSGAGLPPYGGTLTMGGGGNSTTWRTIGALPGDVCINIPTTVAASPGRATIHVFTRSTANFSTATYSSTGGYDLTLSNSCTA